MTPLPDPLAERPGTPNPEETAPPHAAADPALMARLMQLSRPFPRLADLFVMASLIYLGAIVRWPSLQRIPRFTDEWLEVQFALKIAREGARPFVSTDTYNGPLFHYLLAPGFLAGAGLEWPRLLVWAIGALTVGVTYLLGVSVALCAYPPAGGGDAGSRGTADGTGNHADAVRSGAGAAVYARSVGMLAGMLMAVAFIPAVVNSHIAWSNSTTPLFTTLFLFAVVETHRRVRPAGLVVAGLLAGLAQQTHPSALAILLGAAGWIAWMRPRWLRTRWPWLGLVCAALMASNLIAYNLWTGGGSMADAAESAEGFTAGAFGPAYLGNLAGFARMAYQLITSTFLATINETADPAALAAALRQPGAILYALVALAGLAYTARRAGIALACWLAAALLLPVFNQAYHHFILARYLAPLLPPTFAAMGCAVVALATAGAPRLAGDEGMELPAHPPPRSRRSTMATVAAVVLIFVLLLYPLIRLAQFYRAEAQAGRTNDRVWQLVEALGERSTPDHPVRLDRELRHLRLTAGGNLLNTLDGMTSVARIPRLKVKPSEQVALPAGTVIVLSQGQVEALGSVLRLAPIDLGEPPALAAPDAYGLYRVEGRVDGAGD